MRFIPTRVHGVLDYLLGIVLIAAPWLFDFSDGGAKMWVPIVLGVGTIAYSLLTDYELSVAREIPMPVHLMLDIIAGAILAVSPWLFGFADEVKYPHLILGLFEIVAAVLTQLRPAYEARFDRPQHA